MTSGVYRITNTSTGKVYIGSAVSIKRRWGGHRRQFMRGENSRFLQRAWNAYGADAFRFDTVLFCAPKDLLMYEQIVMDFHRSYDHSLGYNIAPTAGSLLGTKLSPETKAKIGAAGRGRKFTAEHRSKIAAAKLGVRRPAEVCAKVSASKKGKKIGPMPPRTAEHRQRLSEARRGRTLNISPDRRAQLIAQMTGNTYGAGKIHSPEHKAKISASLKAAYESGARLRLKPGQTRVMVEAA